jgi:AraC-like DNA-binding protein
MNDPPFISIMSILLLLGAAQGIFLLLALVRTKAGNPRANRWLSGLLLILSISLMDGFMVQTRYYLHFPHLIALEWPTNFAYGPLIYFYVRSLTRTEPPSAGWKTWVHFIPVVALYLDLIPLYTLSAEQKALWWAQSNDPANMYQGLQIDPVIVLIVMQIAVYLLFSNRLLMIHSARIKENFSRIEAINLSWLRKLLLAFFILWMMYSFTFIFSYYLGVYTWAEYLLHLMVALVIYALGFKGVTQSELFTTLQSISREWETSSAQGSENGTDMQNSMPSSNEPPKKEEKYRKSSLTNGQATAILHGLIDLMEKEKPHLEMGLSLADLAERLSVSSNHLSQVINEKLDKSFFDFVNGYRVQEAKRLLLSPESDRLSILGIAMDAGFSSKSAFYTSFKKFTGVTPSKFKALS